MVILSGKKRKTAFNSITKPVQGQMRDKQKRTAQVARESLYSRPFIFLKQVCKGRCVLCKEKNDKIVDFARRVIYNKNINRHFLYSRHHTIQKLTSLPYYTLFLRGTQAYRRQI